MSDEAPRGSASDPAFRRARASWAAKELHRQGRYNPTPGNRAFWAKFATDDELREHMRALARRPRRRL